MKEYPIKLGTMLFTMVQPRPGHEVEYNRWYERDHFYAGCMIGPWNFAGARFVATRDLKALRYPTTASSITPDPQIGSYLALYWVLADHHDEWNRWAVDQVTWLHANGRMFAERDHIHTLLYTYEWAVVRDPDGPSPELALDHRYPGLAVTVASASDRAAMSDWYRTEFLPGTVSGSRIGQVLGFTPLPLLGDAPADVPRTEGSDDLLLCLWFLDTDAEGLWPTILDEHRDALEAKGGGRLVWASPFKPTIVGTDSYADEL